MEAIGTAAETRVQFLQLLVTQLRHQDPLEPTKQEDFLSQLAQFSTLESIESLNENLDGFLANQLTSQEQQNSLLLEVQQFQNMTSAANLVGKEITYTVPAKVDGDDSPVQSKPQWGQVEAVVIEQDNIFLRVEDQLVELDRVLEIAAQPSVETQLDTARRPRTNNSTASTISNS